MFSNFLLNKNIEMSDKEPATAEDDGTFDLRNLSQIGPFLTNVFVLEMAGAMMVERAQSIPAMESIDPKEYLAK